MILRLRSRIFGYFIHILVGVIIGNWFGSFIFVENSNSYAIHTKKHNQTPERKNAAKIRILCLLNTSPKTQYQKAIHIQHTWGRHCDKLLFASTLTDVSLNAIGFNLTDAHSFVWGKEKLMMKYVYENFGHRFDWFYKADDDTFAIMENLRILLAKYSNKDPIYLGYKFNTTKHRWGYNSGGAGYALSKTALERFVQISLTNKTLCPQIVKDKMSEDVNVPKCLAKLNVFAGDSRDWVKRGRFFVNRPEWHLFPVKTKYKWYWKRKYYWHEDGLNCCSNYSISFHHIRPKNLYTLYYLTYQFKPYGINYQHPALPEKLNFNDVIRTLELERINVSYRGY